MSSIASLVLSNGKKVSGSDRDTTETTKELENKGIKIFHNQKPENISSDIDLVVYTVAIPENNPELQRAKELKIPFISYPEFIGKVSNDMKTIAVSGTHGKTTTTAMLAHILKDTEINPTVIIGARMNNQNSNFISGNGKYLLIEADEYKKSFLNLYPTYLVITNIDEDHLDFYKNLNDIQKTFKELADRTPQEGAIICDASNPHIIPVIKESKIKVIDYEQPVSLQLQVVGEHNRKNALSAYSMAKYLGIDEQFILDKLKSFTGVKRRFEYKGVTKNGSKIYDDYAHNPQKVNSALQGAKEAFPNKKVVAIFQPHLYSRTKLLLTEFGESFKYADEIILLPIYGAREEFDPTISSEMLKTEIIKHNKKVKVMDVDSVLNEINGKKKEDIVVILGAGDITNLATTLTNSSSNFVH